MIELQELTLKSLQRIERLLEITILQGSHGKGSGQGASIPWECGECGTSVGANEFHNCATAAANKLAREVLGRTL